MPSDPITVLKSSGKPGTYQFSRVSGCPLFGSWMREALGVPWVASDSVLKLRVTMVSPLLPQPWPMCSLRLRNVP
ncbi:hypothetical protein JOS77_12550 [Chromobacterium haemolyticum]|nr:hypothetical protein JOS77_12550 [Chromobacterium haemolyticum]